MQQQTVKCPTCGAEGAGPQFCTKCGTRLTLVSQQPVSETQPVAPPPGLAATGIVPAAKYGALRAVATVYRIIGWVVMIGGSLFAIALGVLAFGATGTLTDFLPVSSGPVTVGVAIIGLIASILSGLFLVAFADICYLLIDIEKNSRR